MCIKKIPIPSLPPFFEKEEDKSLSGWEKRRQQLLQIFSEEVFGCLEISSRQGFTFSEQILEKKNYTVKEVTVTENSFSASFTLFLPKSNKPCPVLIYPKLRSFVSRIVVPYKQCLSHGYALATFTLDDISDEITGGGELRSVLCPNNSSPCGSVAVWAFFVSLIVDYLYTQPISRDKIGVCGHSRGGKVALWAGANDERISFVFSNNSGCSGAALARGNTGEKIADINKNFPYWFCDNYKKYNAEEDLLPVDFHQLIALLAPRLVYVTSSSRDGWACPKNEFLSAYLASDVYREVFGKKGLLADNPPRINRAYTDGDIAYHIKRDIHSLRDKDWQHVFSFLQKHGWEK